MNYEKIYYVDESDADTRIDRYLADYETEHSRTYIQKLIAEGNQYDEVIAIGPIIMMKFVTEVAKKHNIKIMVIRYPDPLYSHSYKIRCRYGSLLHEEWSCQDDDRTILPCSDGSH